MDYTEYKRLEFRRKFFKLFGASIDIIDADSGDGFGYIEMKAWKLREDIRLYRDNTKQLELIRIHARNVVDFGNTYDVYDSPTDSLLFSLRRKGLRSMFVRDKWEIFDAADQPVAQILETSNSLALLRRYVGLVPFVGPVADFALAFMPLTYSLVPLAAGVPSGVGAKLVHRKNPIVVKMGLDMTDTEAVVDPRMGIAAASLLSVIDAGKN